MSFGEDVSKCMTSTNGLMAIVIILFVVLLLKRSGVLERFKERLQSNRKILAITSNKLLGSQVDDRPAHGKQGTV